MVTYNQDRIGHLNLALLMGNISGDIQHNLLEKDNTDAVTFRMITENYSPVGKKIICIHTIIAFGTLAKTIHLHFKNGDYIFVKGRNEHAFTKGRYYYRVKADSVTRIHREKDEPLVDTASIDKSDMLFKPGGSDENPE